jgi:3-oxo-5-alpha-steroid 4-dehydrogenase 1
MVATPDQIRLHSLLSKLFLLSSLPTYLVTRYVIVAPFGRHVPARRSGGYRRWFGPAFDARVSWFLFECPNLLWSWYYYRCYHWPDSDTTFHPVSSSSSDAMMASPTRGVQINTNAVLASLFALHYVNRAIVYPMRMNPGSQEVPLLVTVLAAAVTTLNGYLQCFHLAHIEEHPPLTPSLELGNASRWAGICLFFAGMAVNVRADGVLRNLRRDNNATPADGASSAAATAAAGNERDGTTTEARERDRAYYIPRSPLFRRVSCPNFLGEMIEWFGFSAASGFSLPSVAFLAYTAGNLIPRAVAHHDWYLRKFDDYPIERKWAVIPLVV